jgi:SEC-C motif-containing protein
VLLLDALRDPLHCDCDCHRTLSLAERTQGIAALFRFDDIMRGWDYQPLYEVGAERLWHEAQLRNDPHYRGVAVRDGVCIFRRLVGFAVHELLHALQGDTAAANYGVPFGLPYAVPATTAPADEKTVLSRFNEMEARAYVGVGPAAHAWFGIDWAVYTARDVGTYGFVPGNAVVPAPPGYRSLSHVDRTLNPQRYYLLARKLEDAARAWFTDECLHELRARFEQAEARGRSLRRAPWPDPASLARLPPRKPGRNDPCPCGSGEKWKACCGQKT